MGLAPPELGQFDGWESSGEEERERERWGWCRRGSSRRRAAAPKGGAAAADAVATGCCIRLWPVGTCPPQPPPPRSKVDTSTSSASTHGGKRLFLSRQPDYPLALCFLRCLCLRGRWDLRV